MPGYAPKVDVSGLPKNVLKNALDKSHKLIKVDDQDTGEVIYCLVIEDDQES